MEQAARIRSLGSGDFDLQAWIDKCYQSLSDNFNSPILIAHLFEAINSSTKTKEHRIKRIGP